MKRRVVALVLLCVFLVCPAANAGAIHAVTQSVEQEVEEVSSDGVVSDGESAVSEDLREGEIGEPTPEPTPMPTVAPVISENIDMSISVGFSGVYVLGNWTEVSVDVENAGDDIDGFLEVDIYGDNQNYTTYRTPAVLPSGSKKRIEMYVMTNYLQTYFDIRLTANDKVVHQQRSEKLTPISPDLQIVGLLSNDPASLSQFGDNQLMAMQLYNSKTISLDASNFPQRNETLSAFKVIIIDNFDVALLTASQRDMLISWLESGGIMIIGGGTRAEITLPSLVGITGVEYDGMVDMTGIALEDMNKEIIDFLFVRPDPSMNYVISQITQSVQVTQNGQTEQNEQALAEFYKDYHFETLPKFSKLPSDSVLSAISSVGDVPVVIGGKVEDGLVVMTAFDLGAKPFSNWQYAKYYIDKALVFAYGGNYSEIFNQKDSIYYSSSMDRDYELIEAVNNIPLEEMPDFTIITILLIAFIIVVGPLGYLVLRLVNRRAWMWGLVPVTTLVFAVLVWGAGSRSRGDLPVATSVSVQPLGTSESLKTIISVASPKRGKHSVSMDAQGLAMFSNNIYSRYSYAYYSGSSMFSSYAVSSVSVGTMLSQQNPQNQLNCLGIINQGATPGVVVSNPEVWGISQMGFLRDNTSEGELSGVFYTGADGIYATLKNNTSYQINDALLITAYGIEAIGTIEPGQSLDVFQQCRYKDGVMDIMQYSLWPALDEMFPYLSTSSEEWQSATPGQREAMLENAFKRSAVSYVYNQKNSYRYSYSQNQYAMNCLVVGFNDELGPIGLSMDETPIERSQHRGVLYQQYPLSFEDGEGNLLIPAGLSALEIEYTPNMQAYTDSGRVIIEQGEVVAYYSLPNLNRYELSKIDIKNLFRTPLKEASFYDEKAEEWVSFTEKDIVLEGKELERFICYKMGNQLRIRYSLDTEENTVQNGGANRRGVTVSPEITLTGRSK